MNSESLHFGILGFVVIAALIGFGIAAIVLRIAVSWYNQLKAYKDGTSSAASPPVAMPVDSNPNPPVSISLNDPNPYRATLATVALAQTHGALPMPGFGRALLIVFLTWAIQFVINLGINAALAVTDAGNLSRLSLGILSIAINFLVGAGLVHSLLPTPRFGQACLVALLQFVIYLLIGLVLGGVFFGIFYMSLPR